MRSVVTAALIGVAFASTAAAQPAPTPPPPCITAGDVQFVCGQQGPEDLVVLPGGQWVVAGSFGGGGINLIRVSDRTSVRAYPTPSSVDSFDENAYKSCPGAPDAAMKAKFVSH